MPDNGEIPKWLESGARKFDRVALVISVSVAVVALILGALNVDNCLAQPWIPNSGQQDRVIGIHFMFLIFYAVSRFVVVPLLFYVEFMKFRARPNKYEKPTIIRVSVGIINALGVALLVLGMYLVFGTSPTFDDAALPTYCHFWTYWIPYAFLVLISLVIVGILSLTCVVGAYKELKAEEKQAGQANAETA
ncbi:hypothetical protein PRIPAC_96528 [Pristionchus pacificus]|uniref:Uncharacterized protein n=1 Tax=Pristionchus pacificus TaxID=54126 RepID=A0A2A6B310_PRIPA|nr:hypothetical protein PRIPAC_96528 [Pristionchus pacificus]|eukprot:PDM60251.1 hypothetical protein PRIPAC_54076 [Pristionchus pacificus]